MSGATFLTARAGFNTPGRHLNNFAATTAPAVTDDTGDGYSVGSLWVNVTADTAYICVDATLGAAVWDEVGGAAGAPTTADYLVGTTQAGLSAEIVVGTTPGGELGGTWASPTVDATHSGSSHASLVTAATVKAVGRWEPVQFDDGSSPWPFVYFNDEIVVAWIDTP